MMQVTRVTTENGITEVEFYDSETGEYCWITGPEDPFGNIKIGPWPQDEEAGMFRRLWDRITGE